MRNEGLVTIDDVQSAAARLQDVAWRTPLLPTRSLSEWAGEEIRLKAECFQRTRSFKIRGAYNTLSRLAERVKPAGIVAYSSGNHGQGVALAARLLRIPAVIVTPVTITATKERGIRRLGARVVKEGFTSVERRARAERIAEDCGFAVVPGFDHPNTVAGQGTVGLEIAQDWPDVDTVVVPVGGGGLVSGVALAIKALRPSAHVIGVEPAAAPSMHEALKAGAPVTIPRPITRADGLAAVRVSELTLAHAMEHVDRIVLVEEDEISHAVAHLLLEENVLVEYSGAAATAALLSGRIPCDGRRVAIVLSGGNIDPEEVSALAASVDIDRPQPNPS